MTLKLFNRKKGFTLLFTLCNICLFAQIDSSLVPFYHGVASGDPTSNRVTLWTRVTPPAGSSADVTVTWKVALDTAFVNVVKSGSLKAKSLNDYTVKVNVTGLQSNKWYYYQFTALNKNSLTGRTRTFPSSGVDSIRFAVVSCSNYQSGYYNVYRSIGQRNDIDVVIHLGDYIYEYGVGGFGYDATLQRDHDPANEAINLSDYRKRHAQTKLDADSRRMLQQYPLIAVWDDHEVANDAYLNGAENHSPGTEGAWQDRLAQAKQAYFEWMPVRKPDPNGDPGRLYRQFKFGNLITLDMLDTRLQGRTEQLATSNPLFSDTSRTMLGINQRNWLFNDINTTTAKWTLLGQQVMISPLTIFGSVLNIDQWDGYPAERNRLYSNLQQNQNKNIVVLTGDIHSAWANDLPLSGYGISNRSASAGVEFVCPSVTSPNPFSTISPGLVSLFNNHVRYVDLSYYGYTLIDVNKNRLQGDWYGVSTITSKTFSTSLKQSWFVNNGEKFLRQAPAASSRPLSKQVPFAPASPLPFVPRLSGIAMADFMEVYPIPATDMVEIRLENTGSEKYKLTLTDITGKLILDRMIYTSGSAYHLEKIDISGLNSGLYFIKIEGNEVYQMNKIIKN